MAGVAGNGVRVGPRQLPDLARRIEAAAHRLGTDLIPTVYVVEDAGRLTAYATTIWSRRFIVLSSALLDACEGPRRASHDDDGAGAGGREAPGELDFVIGQQIGHLAAGHVGRRLFLLPARMLPLFGAAYARACAHTSDRCGHQVVGDLAISSRALAMAGAGATTARRFDADAYADQGRDTGRFWPAVRELNARSPFLSRRIAVLRAWQRPGAAQPAGRNPMAYVVAPLLSFASGGPTSALAIIALSVALAATVALPRIKEQLGIDGGFPASRHIMHRERNVGPDDLFPPNDP
jgi:hypothetical protein